MSGFFELDLDTQLGLMTNAAEQAVVEWGFSDGRLSLIKHRENAVFSLLRPNGDRYAVRVHRLGYHSPQELLSEHTWTRDLAAHGIHSPAPVAAPNEQFLGEYKVGDAGYALNVDVLTWANGEQMGSIEEAGDVAGDDIEATFERLGELMASMHNHSANWVPPADFVRHSWDREGLVGDAPFWGPFWEAEGLSDEQRTKVLSVRKKLRADLAEFGQSSDRFGLVHADFLPENILIEGDDLNLIDFDDGGYGWFMFDIATTLLFQWPEEHYPAVRDALVRGYRKVRPLPDEHLALLPAFVAARGTTYLGWLHTRKETDTAKEMGPIVIDLTEAIFDDYLNA